MRGILSIIHLKEVNIMETLTINGLLNRYFNTDSIELGENKPKLSKQLKKLKIKVKES